MKARLVIFVLAAATAGFFAGRSRPDLAVQHAAASPGPGAQPAAASRPAAPAGLPSDLGPEERRDIEVFRKASASVVYITSVALRRDFFSLDVMRIPQGSGSGFLWDRRGHVVTNFHVIEHGNEFAVTLSDRTSWAAKVIGAAPDKDLAVLRIDAPAASLLPLTLGQSNDLVVGQRVLALGNPFGLDHSLTTGVLSALGRELGSPSGRTIHDVIQTDAAINPGNSGGPLLNSSGKLIGVNSAIYSPSGASAGIGFAVPVDTVRRLIPQLIEHGRPMEPDIGVVWLADSVAARLGLEGAVIYEISQDSPAEHAGLRGIRMSRQDRVLLGDVVIAVEGRPVRSSDQLLHEFESIGVGRQVRLTVERDGKRRDVNVELVPSG